MPYFRKLWRCFWKREMGQRKTRTLLKDDSQKYLRGIVSREEINVAEERKLQIWQLVQKLRYWILESYKTIRFYVENRVWKLNSCSPYLACAAVPRRSMTVVHQIAFHWTTGTTATVFPHVVCIPTVPIHPIRQENPSSGLPVFLSISHGFFRHQGATDQRWLVIGFYQTTFYFNITAKHFISWNWNEKHNKMEPNNLIASRHDYWTH